MKLYRDRSLLIEDKSFSGLANVLVSIVIIFILSSTAISQYRNYVEKIKLSELSMVFLELKSYIHEFYGYRSYLPDERHINAYLASNETFSSMVHIKIRKSDIYKHGQFEIMLVSSLREINEKVVTLTPIIDNQRGSIIWLCGYALPPEGIERPTKNRTTLDKKYLTQICR